MPKVKYGNADLQARMSMALRAAGVSLVRAVPRALGFILIGVPRDGAPRIVHTLPDMDDAYDLMEQLVLDRKTGRTEPGPPAGD